MTAPRDEPTVPVEDPGRGLSWPARGWRLAAAGAGLGVLLVAQTIPPSGFDADDWFPLGSLSQYAFATDPDGVVDSAYVAGVTVTGEHVQVPLDQFALGVGRAEIEAQLDRLVAEPWRLQGIADAWAWRYPDRPRLATVELGISTQQLRGGRPVGEPTTRVIATWQVQATDRSGQP